MNFKKWIALALCLAFLLSLSACKGRTTQPDDLVQTLPPIETAPQKDYTPEEVLTMYNNALDKIANSRSYHMSGSSNSTSVFAGVLSSVVNTYDLKYQVIDGKAITFYDSSLNSDGDNYAHTTYFDGEKYYYNYAGNQYFTYSNGFQDFAATDWLKPIAKTVVLQNLDCMDQLDGSVDISFSIPMGDFMSYAVLDLVGFNSETFDRDPVHLSFTLDSEGTLTYFYISYNSSQIFMDEVTEQTIVASISIDGYDTTTVEIPTGLDSYEDWSEEAPSEDYGGVGNLSPEDVS